MSRSPVSSPTSIMLTTMASQTLLPRSGVGERLTLADGVVDLGERLLEHVVARRFLGDVDRLEDRHAGRDQGAQGAGEAGHDGLAR